VRWLAGSGDGVRNQSLSVNDFRPRRSVAIHESGIMAPSRRWSAWGSEAFQPTLASLHRSPTRAAVLLVSGDLRDNPSQPPYIGIDSISSQSWGAVIVMCGSSSFQLIMLSIQRLGTKAFFAREMAVFQLLCSMMAATGSVMAAPIASSIHLRP
jgi:hypothetical protein